MKNTTKNIFLAFVMVLAVGCAQVDDSGKIAETNFSGFRKQVSALYPGCKFITLSSHGPDYYGDGGYTCYRLISIVELVDGSRKQIQMLCKNGVCWEEPTIVKN